MTTSHAGSPRACVRLVWTLVGLLLVAVAACEQGGSGPDEFERHVRTLESATAISGARVFHASEVERGRASQKVSWEIEVPDRTWEAYGEELTRRLASAGNFRAASPSSTALEFVQALPGDTLVLRLDLLSRVPLRMRATFDAHAD